MMEKERTMFDEFLQQEGVYDEWYQRMRADLKPSEEAQMWQDHPEWWIEEGFIWGGIDADEDKKDEDTQKWIRLNRRWKQRLGVDPNA